MDLVLSLVFQQEVKNWSLRALLPEKVGLSLLFLVTGLTLLDLEVLLQGLTLVHVKLVRCAALTKPRVSDMSTAWTLTSFIVTNKADCEGFTSHWHACPAHTSYLLQLISVKVHKVQSRTKIGLNCFDLLLLWWIALQVFLSGAFLSRHVSTTCLLMGLKFD